MLDGYTLTEIWNNGVFRIIAAKTGIATLIIGWALCIIVSYMLGSLNFGVLISKLAFKDDIRTHGSGNAGMTNMLRTYGKGAAVITLLGDGLKAAVSILVVGRLCCGLWGAYAAGLACIVGHVFPLWFGFKGGKGVVTTAILVLCLDPIAFLILFLIFIAIVAFTKYISLGSVMCMMIYPLVLYRVEGPGVHVLIAIVIALFVIWLHRENIKRIIAGKENKLSLGKKSKSAVPDEDKKEENSGKNGGAD